ncbi:autophagy-related protein 101-like isoform X2 [Apostichopus japonicus]|uniref:autophagy-related protein 101-like isoform X2 n=1 Tax=Stichopus japonicus TaxID=307972 RepID=UPI003AB32E54
MNARSQVFELFHYKQEGAFLIGTVGVVETDCDFVDLTYVRCNSPTLDKNLRREVSAFKDPRSTDVNAGLQSGQISLELYQKKKNRWPFPDESIPWEVWTLKINVISLSNEQERQAYREKLGEILNAKIICIVEAMNRNDYIPKAPNQALLDTVFDTTCPDVQPFLFKISCQNSGPTNASVGAAVRKLLRDTLAL